MQITNIQPGEGKSGTEITFTLADLPGPMIGLPAVTFDGAPAEIVGTPHYNAADETLFVAITADPNSSTPTGPADITVTYETNTSPTTATAAGGFTLLPTITSLSPTSVSLDAEAVVTIRGRNLGPVPTAIMVGSARATRKSANATQITFTPGTSTRVAASQLVKLTYSTLEEPVTLTQKLTVTE